MSVIPGFGSWINQNVEEHVEAESNSPKSNAVWAVDPKYYDLEEVRNEGELWRAEEKKHPWHDVPAKVKVTTKKGLCHMNIEFKLGLPPEGVYEMFTNPNNYPVFKKDKAGRQRLQNKSRKVLKKDGPRQTIEMEKDLSWNFLCWSRVIPIHLIIDENHTNLTAKYRTKNMMFMKVLEGSWKVVPDYVDQERLCKSKMPKSREEYKSCSGGQGKVGSKVTMKQIFEPSALLNLPPVSWIIRGIIIKTTKILLEDIRKAGTTLRTNPLEPYPTFPGFGGWINQNIQQPSKAESKISENNTAKSESEKDTSNQELTYDKEEMKKQYELWSASEKKHPWSDPPPKVKVTTKKGLCHMHIELTMGWVPHGVFELFTNPNNGPLFFDIDGNGRQLLEYKSRKVLKKDGSRQIVKVEQAVAWNFLWWSGAFPISLIVDENIKDHTAKYKKEKMMFMKVFEGSWKIEPLYVDSDRLCKHKELQSVEEYRKCSGGQGRIASKVTMDQYFEPYPLFNLPPVSWCIRGITIKTTKTLLKMLVHAGVVLRE